MNISYYNILHELPLEDKIQRSIMILRNAETRYDNNVYISTGGADSTVLDWLARQLPQYDNIPRVCVGALEPIENTQLNKERGDTIIATSMNKLDVIIKYGYPVISKDVAMKVSRYKNTKHEWVRERRLNGYMGDNGNWCNASKIPNKWQYLIYAPFELSEKCCDFTKKKPLKNYEKETKRIPITGELAEESNDRMKQYLKQGCFHKGKREKVCPLGFWSEQDIKECIRKYNIPLSKAYGEVTEVGGKLYYTKEQRTGCDICGFGIQYDTERFDRIKYKNVKLYNFIMEGGEWIRKDKYRWIKFTPNSIPIYSNLYYQPSSKGYGYKYVLNYIKEGLKC